MATRFERKLYAGFAILVFLFTPVLVGSFVVISELETGQGDLLSKNAQDVIEAERLSALINQEFALIQAFVLRGQSDAINQIDSVHHEFQSTAATLLLGVEVDEDPNLLIETRQLEDENFAAVHEAVALKAKGASIADLNVFFEQSNITRAARVLQLVRKNVKIQTDQMHAARDHVNRISHRLVIGLMIACAFALLATSAVILLLYQMVRRKADEDQRRDEMLQLERDLSNARKEAVEVVAHDLKNPLAAMKMSVELLRDEVGSGIRPSPTINSCFEIAERSIRSMQRLIDDQLDQIKIEAGQLVLETSLANVTEALRDVELRFRPLMDQAGLTFATRFDRALFANIDVTRFDQVLSNLLGNALKFTPHGGVVQLIATREAQMISISVRDNGPGISKEALNHIFERYWQVKETSKKGAGLGLAIAKSIVEALGGTLTCRSEINQGSEFQVRLPSAELARPHETLSH